MYSMFLSLVFPQRLHNTVFRENAGNMIAVLLGILFALPFRNSVSPDSLSYVADAVRNVFAFGDSYSFVSALLFVFLPTLTMILLAFTVFGRHCIPAVFFFYAFFRCFVTCVLLRTFGAFGIVYALALYGLSDLVLLPGLCITACLSGELSALIMKSCRGGGRTDLRKYTQTIMCGLIFPLIAATVSYISVPLFSAFIN